MNQPTQCVRPGCTRTGNPRYRNYCRTHAEHLRIIQPRLPADKPRQHLQNLLNHGASLKSIAEATGANYITLHNLKQGKTPTVSATTAQRVLSLTQPPQQYRQPAWPTMRKLQSLRAAGWTLDELANHTGISRSNISYISTGAWDTVTPHIHNAAEKTWQELSAKPIRPPAKNLIPFNWPLPMEWDDINDPDEKPRQDKNIPVTARILYFLQTLYEETGSYKDTGKIVGLVDKTINQILKGQQTSIRASTAAQITQAYYRHHIDMYTPQRRKAAA